MRHYYGEAEAEESGISEAGYSHPGKYSGRIQKPQNAAQVCGGFESGGIKMLSFHPDERVRAGLGTLGGGNHFIKLDQDEQGNLYVVIHTGSRHLGKEVTGFYLSKGQDT